MDAAHPARSGKAGLGGLVARRQPDRLCRGSRQERSPGRVIVRHARHARHAASWLPGGGEARNLTVDYAGTIDWVGWRDGKNALFAAVEGTRTVLHSVDVATGKRTPAAAGQAVGNPGQKASPMCHSPHFASDRVTYACPAETALHPNEVYIGRLVDPRARSVRARRGAPLRRLTTSNPELETARFAEQEVIRWKSVDGMEIEGILIKPLDFQPGKRYPLVMLPHGGPEGSRENGWLVYTPASFWRRAGFMALYPNYRGSAGRGVAFLKADHGDLAGKEFDDVLAGIDHLDNLGLIDPKRVGIGGWSYGGYFSAWGGTKHSERFAAAVMGAGISNWISYQGRRRYPGRDGDGSLGTRSPMRRFDLVWQRSPMAHIAKAKTPMLILHGGSDNPCAGWSSLGDVSGAKGHAAWRPSSSSTRASPTAFANTLTAPTWSIDSSAGSSAIWRRVPRRPSSPSPLNLAYSTDS